MVCTGWLSHGFLSLTFPPPLCTGVSLLLAFCATLLMFQELSRAELSASTPEAQGSSLWEPFPLPSTATGPSPASCPWELGEPPRRTSEEGERRKRRGTFGGRRWAVWGGCGQFGERLEMELKVRNQTGGWGRPSASCGRAWVQRGYRRRAGWLTPFVEDNLAERGRVQKTWV